MRGALDVLVGGPGLRRGRRDPVDVQIGDAIDFWRVEGFERAKAIRRPSGEKLGLMDHARLNQSPLMLRPVTRRRPLPSGRIV